MKPLVLVFVLRQNSLFLVVKSDVFSYELGDHDFDATKEIIPGKGANHLFKADRLIKTMRQDIKSMLTGYERWRYSAFFAGRESIFITDVPMNNITIRHFGDFTEQMGAKRFAVYYEPATGSGDILAMVHSFLAKINDKEPIGRYNGNYYYKVNDNSFELGEIRRVT